MHHIVSTHTIHLDAPAAQCQRFFTPAGEELWVGGWRPTYLHPADGSTRRGMVFTTGSGAEHTIWTLLDYDLASHYARYSRVTPGSRSALVEVRCTAVPSGGTAVEVTYAVTALEPSGVPALPAYEGAAFTRMIDDWQALIAARLPELLSARIR